MAIVRILVDGYSLLHAWPELCRGKAPHSEWAREELVQVLTRYQDATGIPITIFFDGARPHSGIKAAPEAQGIEVLFSRSGQTADQMIERAAHRFKPFGEVLAVTNDVAERETVLSLGGFASSCINFIETIASTLSEQADDIKHHNRKERNRFNRAR